NGTRELILNEGQAIHSIYYPNPKIVLTGQYWDYFLAAPYFNAGFTPQKLHRIGIIGLAAGTIAHQFTKVYGPVPIDGVEIDPAIVNVGHTYFGMNEPNLRVYVQDGRTFIDTTYLHHDISPQLGTIRTHQCDGSRCQRGIANSRPGASRWRDRLYR